MPHPAASDLLHAPGTPPIRLRIVRPVNVLDAGSHHPLLCEMESDAGPAGIWVVKPPVVLSVGSSYGAFSVVAELAGTEVCVWAGLASPAVGLVTFPSALDRTALEETIGALESAKRKEIVEAFSVNRGRVAFCCRHLGMAADLVPAAILRLPKHRRRLIADAVALAVADAFMLHTDREVENPNALWFDGRIVAIDHNLAFAPLARRGSTGADVARNVIPNVPSFRRHVAAEVVRAHGEDEALWDGPVQQLTDVPDAAILALAASWPIELDEEPSRSLKGIRQLVQDFLWHRRAYIRDTARNLRATLRGTP